MPNRTNHFRLLVETLLIALISLWSLSSLAQNTKTNGIAESPTSSWKQAQNPDKIEPFYGEHQGGVLTPPQHHIYYAAFDLTTTKREDVIKLLKAWTTASERLSRGETAQPLTNSLQLAVTPSPSTPEMEDQPISSTMAADTGETIGMTPSRLTITFGFGSTLFAKDGKDRYGLASRRPAALVDMPKFNGDQMAPDRTGGDIVVQACAEDPQVAFHAVRQLARIAAGVAQLRWVQVGYRPTRGERHLLGFSNGVGNPNPDDVKLMAKNVWVGDEGPAWMRGGTYAVVRRIRFALEHWDQMPAAYQEQAVGESKHPNVQKIESPSGSLVSDDETLTHLQLATPDAKSILRRSYSFNDGLNFTVERWPPWRQGLEYDAGMLFICYQRDARTGFIPMYDKLAKFDFVMNQFWTHEGGGLFAYPAGVKAGEYIGQRLFEN